MSDKISDYDHVVMTDELFDLLVSLSILCTVKWKNKEAKNVIICLNRFSNTFRRQINIQ